MSAFFKCQFAEPTDHGIRDVNCPARICPHYEAADRWSPLDQQQWVDSGLLHRTIRWSAFSKPAIRITESYRCNQPEIQVDLRPQWSSSASLPTTFALEC